MKSNTIARTVAAVILSLGALLAMSGAASADEPDKFTPPYCAQP
ncbi:hypothetical protein GCM10011609_62400 [Lentzea pudingi]|uniref:Uncharacterized protein n=1 Tax=Lentzea pudingi TaxID=1789439 RepID=A0ABQ2IMB4_9PSEU|nr:hypothetical protein [Lentzea pudingi]GGN13440.1 hypothetical protein GCM10011609_62400 [Lentzea pudingi]